MVRGRERSGLHLAEAGSNYGGEERGKAHEERASHLSNLTAAARNGHQAAEGKKGRSLLWTRWGSVPQYLHSRENLVRAKRP
jgi:hypothetical protein